jgi:transposase
VDDPDPTGVVRARRTATGTAPVLSVPTAPDALARRVDQAHRHDGRAARVAWVQESTTGWARVRDLLGAPVDFQLANVRQMPRPPKAHRNKTDQVDTARLQRASLAGSLPRAHPPPAAVRRRRRLVAWRDNLVSRRTALRNWVNRYLAHETWLDRRGLWSAAGLKRLRARRAAWPATGALVVRGTPEEREALEGQLGQAGEALRAAYRGSPEAQRRDAIRGIAEVAAASIVARIGPAGRFRSAEQLIAFAGLAPGVRPSDQTRRDGRIGGGGTDRHLRHDVIEATVWARQLPRYRATYERVERRRGKKIGRLVVARLLLRSSYEVRRDGVAFAPSVAPSGG